MSTVPSGSSATCDSSVPGEASPPRCQVAPWLSIQPHAQYVMQPGGTDDIDNALILGIRTNIAF
jgi:hypothetical protein